MPRFNICTVNAEDFGLAAGIATLRKLAALKSSSLAVPVSALLIFSAG